MFVEPDPSKILPNIKEGIDLYFERRLEPGSFTRACLENDLMKAMSCADPASMYNLPHICAYLRWNVPARSSGVWGSYQAVQNFLDER